MKQLKRILFVLITVGFAACSSPSSADATKDSMTQVMDSTRVAVKDSVRIKADSNERTIDSSFKVMKDSINK